MMTPEAQLEIPENVPAPRGWRRYAAVFSIISIAVLCMTVFLIGLLVTSLGETQWDFITYYYAGKISAMGGDVYNVDASRQMSDGYVHQYLYPPMAARLFRPLASLPIDTARKIWFWLHVPALAGLIWIWRRFFITGRPIWPFYLLAIFGFSNSIFLDFKAGNVTIFEQLLLWSGFAFLVRKKTALFCLFLVGASFLKALPLLFLGILFLLSVDRKWLYAAGTTALYGLVQVVDYVADPAAYSTYIAKVLAWDERGPEFNPSILALLKDLKREVVTPGFSGITADVVQWTMYAAVVLVVAIVTWRLIRRTYANRTGESSDESATLLAVLGSTLAFGIVAPRFKIYAFMMALPAVYFVIRQYGRFVIVPMAIILAALTTHPHLPMEQSSIDLFWWYYPLLVLILCWVAWVVGTIKSEKNLLPAEHSPTAD